MIMMTPYRHLCCA